MILWGTVHVFEAVERGRSAQYKLTSTVMLYMTKPVQAAASETNKGEGEVALGGSMTRQVRVPRARVHSHTVAAQRRLANHPRLTLRYRVPPDQTARIDGAARHDFGFDARTISHCQRRQARRGHGAQDAQPVAGGLLLQCVRLPAPTRDGVLVPIGSVADLLAELVHAQRRRTFSARCGHKLASRSRTRCEPCRASWSDCSRVARSRRSSAFARCSCTLLPLPQSRRCASSIMTMEGCAR